MKSGGGIASTARFFSSFKSYLLTLLINLLNVDVDGTHGRQQFLSRASKQQYANCFPDLQSPFSCLSHGNCQQETP
jgi:hypothetical protein